MAPRSSPWPVLAAATENSAASSHTINLTQRAVNQQHDAKAIIEHVREGRGSLPKPVMQFVEAALKTAEMLTMINLDSDLRRELKELSDRSQREFAQLRHDVTTVRIQTDPKDTLRSVSSGGTYADAIRRGIGLPSTTAPTSTTQRTAGTGTPGVSAYELDRDRKVIVKLASRHIIERLRATTPLDIVRKVEDARVVASRDHKPLRRVKVVAAKQLRSGDVSLATRTAAEAETMRRHRAWLGIFGDKAEVKVPTYGKVVDGIPIKSIKLVDKDGIESAIENLKARHQAAGQKASSIVIEFVSPVDANRALWHRCFGRANNATPGDTTARRASSNV
ncbi:hypothetical protein AtubIFM54640_011650 [Aspergillus tubingensis]|nr:hypothetical protein AtubIFM54640_011650 [Aspergillus tubingensis]